MNIEYLWIKEFGGGYISNQNIDFGGKYIFDYDEKNKKLAIRDNEQYIDNFFDDEGLIKGVTGIIGANGAGKTTIINFLKDLHKDGVVNTKEKYIIVTSQRTSAKDVVNIFYHNSLIESEIQNQLKGIETKIIPIPYSEEDGIN